MPRNPVTGKTARVGVGAPRTGARVVGPAHTADGLSKQRPATFTGAPRTRALASSLLGLAKGDNQTASASTIHSHNSLWRKTRTDHGATLCRGIPVEVATARPGATYTPNECAGKDPAHTTGENVETATYGQRGLTPKGPLGVRC